MSESLVALQSRYNKLRRNGKNIDSQGVLRKLARAMRKQGYNVTDKFN